jgi:hypothetical protein
VQSADATIQFWLNTNGRSVTTYTLNEAGHPPPSKAIFQGIDEMPLQSSGHGNFIQNTAMTT